MNKLGSVYHLSVEALQALAVHPVADLFPYVNDEDMLNLAQDLEVNGQVNPIVVYEDEILDGRNRLRAMAKADLTDALVVEYQGDDPIGFVLSVNLHRRQLSAIDRGKLALALKPHLAAEAAARRAAGLTQYDSTVPRNYGERGETNEHLGALVGLNADTIRRIEKVMLNAPELLDAAKSINEAFTALQRQQKASPGATPGDVTRADRSQADLAEQFSDRVEKAKELLITAVSDYWEHGTPADMRFLELNLAKVVQAAECWRDR